MKSFFFSWVWWSMKPKHPTYNPGHKPMYLHQNYYSRHETLWQYNWQIYYPILSNFIFNLIFVIKKFRYFPVYISIVCFDLISCTWVDSSLWSFTKFELLSFSPGILVSLSITLENWFYTSQTIVFRSI